MLSQTLLQFLSQLRSQHAEGRVGFERGMATTAQASVGVCKVGNFHTLRALARAKDENYLVGRMLARAKVGNYRMLRPLVRAKVGNYRILRAFSRAKVENYCILRAF